MRPAAPRAATPRLPLLRRGQAFHVIAASVQQIDYLPFARAFVDIALRQEIPDGRGIDTDETPPAVVEAEQLHQIQVVMHGSNVFHRKLPAQFGRGESEADGLEPWPQNHGQV